MLKVEERKKGKFTGSHYLISIDTQKGYCVTTIEHRNKERTHWITEHQIGKLDGDWYPVERKTYIVDKMGKRKLARTATVSNLIRDATIPDERFQQLEFPKGTKIWYSHQ